MPKYTVVIDSNTTPKPKITYPLNDFWFSSLTGAILKWSHEEKLQSVTVEVTRISDNEKFTYTETNAITTQTISQIDLSTKYGFPLTGRFSWRIKAKAFDRLNASEFTSAKFFGIDSANPKVIGIDIVVPHGNNSEEHSALDFKTSQINSHGIHIGRENGKIKIFIRNTKNSYPITVWTKTPFASIIESSEKALSFVSTTNSCVVVEQGGFIKLSTATARLMKFEFHQANSDLFAGVAPAAMPVGQEDFEVIPQVFVGRTKTPPYAMIANVLNLVINNSQEKIIVSGNAREDKTNKSFSNGRNGAFLNYSKSNLARVGDYAILGMSHKSTPDGKTLNGEYLVSGVNSTSVRLDELAYANSFSSVFTMPPTNNWTKKTDSVGRVISTGIATGYNWNSISETGVDFVQYPITNNSFAGRWLGIKRVADADAWKYYPIYSNSGPSLSIVGDPSIDFASGVAIDAVITGDEVVIVPDMFIGELNKALIYIGCDESLSGIASVSIRKQIQPIASRTDFLGNKIESTIRQEIIGNFAMQQYGTGFFPLDNTFDGNNKFMEIAVVSKNRAGLVSASSWGQAYYSSARTPAFGTIATDTKPPVADFFANLGAKHLSSLRPVIDVAATTDNVQISEWKINNSELYLKDFTTPSMTWHREKLQNLKRYVIENVEVNEDNPALSIVTLKSTPAYDVVNSFARFNSLSPVFEARIIDIVGTNKILVESDNIEVIKIDAEFEVNSFHTFPDIGYVESGLYTTIYADKTETENAAVYATLSSMQSLAYYDESKFTASMSTFPSGYDFPYGFKSIGYVYAPLPGNYTLSWVVTGMVIVKVNNSVVANGGIKNLESGWHKLEIEYVGQTGQKLDSMNFGFAQSSGFSKSLYNASGNKAILQTNLEIQSEEIFPGKNALLASSKFNAISASEQNGKISVVCDVVISRTHSKYIMLPGDFIPRQIYWGLMEVNSSSTLIVEKIGSLHNSGESISVDFYLPIVDGDLTELEFAPSQSGFITGIGTSGSYTTVSDSEADWNVNQWKGSCVSFQGAATWGVVIENTTNVLTVDVFNRYGTPLAPLTDHTYIVGQPQLPINPEPQFLVFAPGGVPVSVSNGDDLVHRAATISCSIKDWHENQSTTTKYFSLFGADVSSTETISGGIIDYNLLTDNWNFHPLGTTVFDATYIDEITGVYVSRPIPGPAGLSAWRNATWAAKLPLGSEIIIEVRTATSITGLSAAAWNRDSLDNYISPWKSIFENVENPQALCGATLPCIPFNHYVRTDSNTYTADISTFTYNGALDDVPRKWIQYKIIFVSNSAGATPLLSSFKLSYSSSQNRVVLFKNVILDKEIVGGFLSPNMDIPAGCKIEWGISTEDSTDFGRFQPIPIDEAFKIISPSKQYRIGAKLISSDSAAPKIHDMSFMYDTGSVMHQKNIGLYNPIVI